MIEGVIGREREMREGTIEKVLIEIEDRIGKKNRRR